MSTMGQSRTGCPPHILRGLSATAIRHQGMTERLPMQQADARLLSTHEPIADCRAAILRAMLLMQLGTDMGMNMLGMMVMCTMKAGAIRHPRPISMQTGSGIPLMLAPGLIPMLRIRTAAIANSHPTTAKAALQRTSEVSRIPPFLVGVQMGTASNGRTIPLHISSLSEASQSSSGGVIESGECSSSLPDLMQISSRSAHSVSLQQRDSQHASYVAAGSALSASRHLQQVLMWTAGAMHAIQMLTECTAPAVDITTC